MNKKLRPFKRTWSAARHLIALACALLLWSGEAATLVRAAPVIMPLAPAGIPADQLDSLVAPIALYPDDLLGQTLVASTYPLEIIQLQQWLDRNQHLAGDQQKLLNSVQKQPWDPSIQAMAALPDVVKRLADDIQWTTDLGNAFLAQQSDVFAAIQRMRQKAQQKGALQSNGQQTVETQVVESQQVIVIEQTNPEVVYVPSYDPVYAYGPAVYPYPSIYYPPYYGGVYAAAAISFGVGVAMGAFWGGGWGWGCGWGGGDIDVNMNNNFNRNTNIGGGNRVNNIGSGNRVNPLGGNRGGVGDRGGVGNRGGLGDRGGVGGRGGLGDRGGLGNRGGLGGRNQVNPLGGGNKWQHNPSHRGGAPYGDRATADRFGGTTRGDSLANRQRGARNQLGRTGGNLGSATRPGGVGNRGGLGSSGLGNRGGLGSGGVGNRGGLGSGGVGNRGGLGSGGVGNRGGLGSGGVGNRGGLGSSGVGNRGGLGSSGVGNRGGLGSSSGIGNRGGFGGSDRVGNRSIGNTSRDRGAFGGFSRDSARSSSNRGSSSIGRGGFGGGGGSRGSFGGGGSRGGGGFGGGGGRGGGGGGRGGGGGGRRR